MKKRILLLLLCAFLLLPLVSCQEERYELLHSQEIDGITYCIRGKKDTPKQIVVKDGNKVLWSQKIESESSLDTLRGEFVLEVVDLNFDGTLDLMLSRKEGDSLRTALCWFKSADGYDYRASKVLSDLLNVKADEKLKAIFAFALEQRFEAEENDPKMYTVTTYATTKYLWQEDDLIPEMRASITHYSNTDLYCYSLSYYNETTGTFDDSTDKWLTAEEYQNTDFGFLFYFE